MNMRQILLTGLTVTLLTTTAAWLTAGNGNGNGNQDQGGNQSGNGGRSGGNNKAPEIDAASGTSAIALLTGVLLLAGERSRSRRS